MYERGKLYNQNGKHQESWDAVEDQGLNANEKDFIT